MTEFVSSLVSQHSHHLRVMAIVMRICLHLGDHLANACMPPLQRIQTAFMPQGNGAPFLSFDPLPSFWMPPLPLPRQTPLYSACKQISSPQQT